MAEEHALSKRQVVKRRVLWQIAIFMIAMSINVIIAYREVFVLDSSESTPDSDLNLATNLCKGIGYIVIGNLYDNVPRPKRLTFIILLCLALATGLVIIKLNKLCRVLSHQRMENLRLNSPRMMPQ